MAFNGSGAIKAWVTASSGGSNLKSYGISSVSDDGTGQLGVTMSTASSNANYCVLMSYEMDQRVNPNFVLFLKTGTSGSSDKTTTAFKIETNAELGGLSGSVDNFYILVVDTF